jgi:nitrous oxidase accessory protein NosD
LTQAPGTITGNVISAKQGVLAQCPSETISGNTITGELGISVQVGSTINGNTINATVRGIDDDRDQSSVIKGNQIFNARVGIDLFCVLPATISGNQFIGTAVGLAGVPTGTTLDKTAGNFFGVPTIQQLCNN